MQITKEAAGFEVKVGEEVFAYDTIVEVVAKVNEVFGEAAPAAAPTDTPAAPAAV